MEEQLNSKSAEFLPVQGKKMVSILKKLEQSYEYGRKTKTKEILKTRADKKAEFGGKKNNRIIIQNLMKPGCAVSRVFSQQAPISKGVPYLNEKEKRKVIDSNRAHIKMNNFVSGKYIDTFIKHTPAQQRQIIQRKFQDYDRVVTSQTGALRLNLHRKQPCATKVKKPIYSTKRVTTFSTYESDNHNFYKDSDQGLRTSNSRMLVESMNKSPRLEITRVNRTKTQSSNFAKFHEIYA